MACFKRYVVKRGLSHVRSELGLHVTTTFKFVLYRRCVRYIKPQALNTALVQLPGMFSLSDWLFKVGLFVVVVPACDLTLLSVVAVTVELNLVEALGDYALYSVHNSRLMWLH